MVFRFGETRKFLFHFGHFDFLRGSRKAVFILIESEKKLYDETYGVYGCCVKKINVHICAANVLLKTS